MRFRGKKNKIGAVLPEGEGQVATFFAPQDDCTGAIVYCVNSVEKGGAIFVMAYALTCPKILRALCNAIDRGVKVSVLLDNSYEHRPHLDELKAKGVIFIDSDCRIAHNKVMVMVNKSEHFSCLVINGSFNFSAGASSNAENLVITVDDEVRYKLFLKNWFFRKELAKTRPAEFDVLRSRL